MAKGSSWRVRPAAEVSWNLPARWCAGARDGLDHPAAGPSKVLLGVGVATVAALTRTAGSETLRTDDGTLPGCCCACWVARAWPGRNYSPSKGGDRNTVRRPVQGARGLWVLRTVLEGVSGFTSRLADTPAPLFGDLGSLSSSPASVCLPQGPLRCPPSSRPPSTSPTSKPPSTTGASACPPARAWPWRHR